MALHGRSTDNSGGRAGDSRLPFTSLEGAHHGFQFAW